MEGWACQNWILTRKPWEATRDFDRGKSRSDLLDHVLCSSMKNETAWGGQRQPELSQWYWGGISQRWDIPEMGLKGAADS